MIWCFFFVFTIKEIRSIRQGIFYSIFSGQPPILVLSYKNHAIDEFLRDLINSESNNLSLIRIGGSCKDQALMQFAEQNQPSFRQVNFLILY
jgi:hypothetical protein